MGNDWVRARPTAQPVKGEGRPDTRARPIFIAKGGCAMQAAASQVRWVPVEDILPFAASETDEAPDGPVLITPDGEGKYRLVAGSASLRRMREAGQLCVDAVIAPPGRVEKRVSQLLDQLVRGEIHYLDEAKAYRDLLEDSGWTAQRLAERLGRTPATLSRKLRLLELGREVSRCLRENGLCERYAQALLRVPGQQGRLRILRHVTEEGLSVKDTEKLIDDVLSRMPLPMTGGRRMKPLMRDYRLYVNAIRGIVEQMGDAGLEGSMQVTVGRHVAEVRVTIPIFTKGTK